MKEEIFSSDESEKHVNVVTSSVSIPKKSKTKAERQREYRLRLKQKMLNNVEEKKRTSERKIEYQRQYRLKKRMLKAQNKPPKKTRADYQREYRLRKKLKAELNSGSVEMIPRQEAGPSWYLAPVTTSQLTLSNPNTEHIIIKQETDIETVELPTGKRKKKAQEQLENVSKVRKLKTNKTDLQNSGQLEVKRLKRDVSPPKFCSLQQSTSNSIETEQNKLRQTQETVDKHLEDSDTNKKDEFQPDEIQFKSEPIDIHEEPLLNIKTEPSDLDNSNLFAPVKAEPSDTEVQNENVLEPLTTVLLPTIKTEVFFDENEDSDPFK